MGQRPAIEPAGAGLWATNDPPPRPGNQLDVLIDGTQALAAIAEALAGARSHVHVTAWHLAAHLEVVRGERPVVLGALLGELAERVDVRVLVWVGAPVPAFHPHGAAATRAALDRRARAGVDRPHRPRVWKTAPDGNWAWDHNQLPPPELLNLGSY